MRPEHTGGEKRRGEGIGAFRRRVLSILELDDFDAALRELSSYPPPKLVNPLLSAFYSGDKKVRWLAVTAFGQTVSRLAEGDMEEARVIMRRLMWSLNDESGGIGWGAPEAMAEVMACHAGLAAEYARILLSYIREDENFLEYEPLRRGALWGVGRLGEVRPAMLAGLGAVKSLLPYLDDPDPESRALAARALGMLKDPYACKGLEALKDDRSPVDLYVDRELVVRAVGDIAREAFEGFCH